MNNRIETTILYNLVHNIEYSRKVLPFLKIDYFNDLTEKVLFKIISNYITKYNNNPTTEVIFIKISNLENISEDQFNSLNSYVDENLSSKSELPELTWLIDETEKFCKTKAIYNAVRESISILDDGSKKKPTSDIPKLLSDALSVSFDPNIGHDFIEDSDKRYDFYNQKVEKIPFDLDYFNRITGGGVERKSLTVILAGTAVGKSLALCHFASSFLAQGKNVLYITLEMSEEKIAQRIDANLLNIDISKLQSIPKNVYDSRIGSLKNKTTGKLIIKEYPTASANCNHFRHLLSELKLKKKFIPDVMFVDYLNIASSTRSINIGDSYTYAKSIAEELRGIAVEFNIPVMTATQSNRQGYTSSDPGLENTSECIFVDEKVELVSGKMKSIGDIVVGDQIKANDEYKTVIKVHHKKIKRCYKITTKSGNSIIVSKDHVFPSSIGRKSISNGLGIGDKLKTK
jgi:replicative DNA helicase